MARRAARNDEADLSVVKLYVTEMRRRWLSDRTIYHRVAFLERFAAFLHPTTLVSATADDIEAWLATCNLGARSRTTYLAALRAFYDYTARFGLTPGNPARSVRMPRTKRLLPRPIKDDDLRFAMRAAEPRMRAWLSLAAYQGFRCVEISGLRREDLLFHLEPPMVMVSHAKGGHEALLPLNPIVEHNLRAYGLPASGYVFTLGSDHHPFTPGTVSSYIGVYLHGLGIEGGAHRLRHWYGTTLYGATKDLRLTQEMMRHQHPMSTTIYTLVAESDASEAVRALDVGDYGAAERRQGTDDR